MSTATTADVNDYGVMSFDDLDTRLHATLDRAERVFADAIQIAKVIRDRTLWRPKFRSFDAYLDDVAEKRNVSRIHKWRLAQHLRISLELDLSDDDDLLPHGNIHPEAHSRKLGTLPEPEDRRQAHRGASRAAAAQGTPVQQRHINEATDRLHETTKIVDPGERKRAQQQAMDDWLDEESSKSQHRTQRPRVDKFTGHAEQQAKILRASTPAECEAMLSIGLKTCEAGVGKLAWAPAKIEKLRLRLAAVMELFE